MQFAMSNFYLNAKLLDLLFQVKDKAAKQELETICEQAEVIQKEFKISRRNRHVESSLEKV